MARPSSRSSWPPGKRAPRPGPLAVPLTLRNLDTFAAQAEGSRGPVTDTEGLRWWGGELSVRLLPVVYSPGREITSAVVELHTPGGPSVAQAGVLGQGPFTARFPSTPGAPGSIAGYQTTADGGDALRVTTARYADGGLVPGLPIPLEGGLHLDLRPPEPTSFVLPRAWDLEDCCLQNWVGSAFRFASALGEVEDRGVGGAGVTFHAGAADLEDAAVAELPPFSRRGRAGRQLRERGLPSGGGALRRPGQPAGGPAGTRGRESPGERTGGRLRRGPHAAPGGVGSRRSGAWGPPR
jgi:hypothetical protein